MTRTNASLPLRVLFLIDHFRGVGGAENNILTLARKMDRTIISPYFGSFNLGDLRKELGDCLIDTLELQPGSLYGLVGARNASHFLRFVRRNRIEAIISYYEASDFFNAVIAPLAGVRIHISNRRDTGYRLKNVYRMMYSVLNGRFDRIIAVSEAVRESITGCNGNKVGKKIRVVRNGVDTDRFRPGTGTNKVRESLGIPADAPVAGMVGNFREEKGHLLFLHAAAAVLQKLPSARFLFVGGEERPGNPVTTKVESVGRELGISDRLFFTGRRPHSDVPELLAAMDVFVLPSTTEGLSNALLEAMACGVPTVATSVGGNTEVVEDGKAGYLVPAGDVNSLAEKISALMEDKRLREELGAAARKRAVEAFSIDAMLNQMKNLILEVRGLL